ncbi:hypothetical protein HMPREF9727_02157 [Treponema denticola MYR-T]|uniref:Uncharacterized protein n=1 Tax=Treponema denticola H1-T TaxID=999431 RepID=M2BFC7_TREDN|nr:hypothetical protein HMPREF9727_02157 [Treponema denticola MYR-T]EMB28080.1 hypothetical protein HMPREF9725_02510 [Treponema denticola H1-T]EMB38388.1 hypothetical protein HMPREF9722_02268 [Treponema denticola ATCC 33520]
MVFIGRCIGCREKAINGRHNLQICGHLRCRFAKNSPRRTTSTPAGVFCMLLASAPPICKLSRLLPLFTSPGVSVPTWRSVVLSSSDVFVPQKLDVEKCTRMYTFQHACGCFCALLASVPPICKLRIFSFINKKYLNY